MGLNGTIYKTVPLLISLEFFEVITAVKCFKVTRLISTQLGHLFLHLTQIDNFNED